MFERSELALKILCGVAAAFVLYRLVLAIVHFNPLYHVTIPALPTLPAASASASGGTGTNAPVAAGGRGTNVHNQAAATKGTNGTTQATNSVARGTNNPGLGTNLVKHSTNRVDRSTNDIGRANNSIEHTNKAVAAETRIVDHGSNASVRATNTVSHTTNSLAQGTNAMAAGTNAAAAGTNLLAQGTNSTTPPSGARPGQGGPRPPELGRRGMPPGGFPGMPKPAPELPGEIQARIDRVIDSEIIAPVMRPLPMALLGIAGNSIFLRAPNGQTGLIKEGEELGGVKLVRIGVNRVLVDQQGEQKELMIFAGLGGETLLSTQKVSSK